MTNSARTGLILGLLLAANFAVPTMAADSFSVNKNVDRYAADPSDLLTYSITVANAGFTAVTIGLFSDEFPDEVTGCTWTCSTAGGGWCEHAGGSGDIEQLLSVPVGSTATVDSRDNTATNPGIDGDGVGIFLVNGVTRFAM